MGHLGMCLGHLLLPGLPACQNALLARAACTARGGQHYDLLWPQVFEHICPRKQSLTQRRIASLSCRFCSCKVESSGTSLTAWQAATSSCAA